MSDEGDVADDAAARDSGDTDDSRALGGQTAVATESSVRPHRPTGKRARLRAADTDDESPDESQVKDKSKDRPTKKAGKKTKKSDRTVNPFVFVYNYLKQVVAELRKVIWPNRKQMFSYTGVVLAFLAFMVALVGLADFGLAKLVMLVFG